MRQSGCAFPESGTQRRNVGAAHEVADVSAGAGQVLQQILAWREEEYDTIPIEREDRGRVAGNRAATSWCTVRATGCTDSVQS